MRRTVGFLLALAAFSAPASAAVAQEGHEGHGARPQHLAIDPGDLEWVPAPPSLPPGAQVAVLEGDPTQEGPFTIRIQLPAGYKVAPHVHHGAEHLTILSGRAGLGLGETWDGEKIRYAGPGGFFVTEARIAHFAMVEEDSIVQVHGMGPWVLEYVNAADDPRGAPAAAATND